MTKRILGRDTGAANRYPTLLGLLATFVGTTMIAAPIAHANIFDKLKKATSVIKDVKKDVKKVVDKKHAAAPQSPANQPPAAQPAAKQAVKQAGAASPAATAGNPGPVGVAQKVVGPLLSSSDINVDNGPAYTVSLHGSHLATVHMHGSRYVVSIDGVDGPRVEGLLSTYTKFANNSGLTFQNVAMSDDGAHYAYLARARGKIELIDDSKQILQFPQRGAIQSGNSYLFFSPHGGAHLFFAAENANSTEMEMWVDGKPVPSFDGGTSHPSMFTFSPDGKHYLYAGYPEGRNSKPFLVVDGKKMDYPTSGLSFGLLAPRFTADSRHVLYVTSRYVGKIDAKLVGQVLLDGKPVVTAEQIQSVVMSPKGNSFAAVVSTGNSGSAVYLNGKEVPNTRGKPGAGMNNSSPVAEFSPDGKHLAVACNYGAGNAYVVLDGKRGETYDKIYAADEKAGGLMMRRDGMLSSADSQSFGYFAGVGSSTKTFVVVDGNEYDQAFDGAGTIYFSPEGHHVAVVGEKDDVSGQVLYVDGKRVVVPQGGFSGRFAFDRDGSHWMNHGQGLVVDGQKLPVSSINAMPCRFSPDGSEVAVVGSTFNGPEALFLYNTSTRRLRLLTKGSILGEGAFSGINADPYIYHVVFSPDSKHLYYSCLGVQQQHATIYVDGEKTAAQFDPTIFPPFGNFASSQKAGCWNVGADDTLHALCAVGKEVERITITPPPGGLGSVPSHG